jgi:hypothetical protein
MNKMNKRNVIAAAITIVVLYIYSKRKPEEKEKYCAMCMSK